MLYHVVRDHFETFRAQVARISDGNGLPRFIEEEFRGFLRCGFLAGGFARFQCDGCGVDRLVPFSCKSRAICPSCAGRRMAERAAHLVDHVFPEVPVRQWVLTVPHRVRYVLAWDHALCRAVVGVFMRAVLGFLRRRAREQQGVADGRGGAVVIVQRFGAALNVNVHSHALVVDGVFAENGSGGLGFHPAAPPTDEEMEGVLGTIERRIGRMLARHGLTEDGAAGDSRSDRWAEEAPVLAGIAGASVQGRIALGPRAGAEVRRCGAALESASRLSSVLGPCHAHQNGFDLHAGLVVPARDRARLERVCRYALRPPVAHDRIRLADDGQVLLELRHRWSDGTTHLLFDPIELLERLAALTPRPRINLVLYYGVLGAHAAWRARLIGREASEPSPDLAVEPDTRPEAAATSSPQPRSNLLWAQLMARSFGFDVLHCTRCGGRFRLIALIDDPRVIQKILSHLDLPTDAPAARPPRAPPIPFRRHNHHLDERHLRSMNGPSGARVSAPAGHRNSGSGAVSSISPDQCLQISMLTCRSPSTAYPLIRLSAPCIGAALGPSALGRAGRSGSDRITGLPFTGQQGLYRSYRPAAYRTPETQITCISDLSTISCSILLVSTFTDSKPRVVSHTFSGAPRGCHARA